VENKQEEGKDGGGRNAGREDKRRADLSWRRVAGRAEGRGREGRPRKRKEEVEVVGARRLGDERRAPQPTLVASPTQIVITSMSMEVLASRKKSTSR